MPRISNFNAFLIVLWWPLPFLPDVGWENVFTVFLLTLFIGFFKLLSDGTPQEPYQRKNLAERHRIPWKRIALVLAGLEVVLIVFIWTFGAGREQVQPYAGWLAPFAEAAIRYVPKFRLTADKLIELGLPERVNIVVAAWAIAYLAQIPIAALWVPPVLRRLRELPMPEGTAEHVQRRPILLRCAFIFCIICLLALIVVLPEVWSDGPGRKSFFWNFKTQNSSLFYYVVLHPTVYSQLVILCLIWLFTSTSKEFRRKRSGLAAQEQADI